MRAHAWREALEQGTVSSTTELAAQAGCHVRYVRSLLKLAFLAPDLIEAVLSGRQTPGISLASIIRSDLPLSWMQQRSSLTFDAYSRTSGS